jgi:nickel/cobalt exporter
MLDMTQSAGSRRRRFARALLLAVGLSVLLPAIALAYPLGNFTVNHFAGIRIEPDRIVLDVVIDEAEISHLPGPPADRHER